MFGFSLCPFAFSLETVHFLPSLMTCITSTHENLFVVPSCRRAVVPSSRREARSAAQFLSNLLTRLCRRGFHIQSVLQDVRFDRRRYEPADAFARPQAA